MYNEIIICMLISVIAFVLIIGMFVTYENDKNRLL